ncbi:hypothetical protein FSP39_010057 [Pinctada imbricata]|uniref:Uncharacterized protein n=1 Tax=Pinctada imbricata TaxID=66713 RepID=A0AA88Y6Z8_PINIB|nr:hypothetical protein FSP39_010057 [Pinctada imbricata]
MRSVGFNECAATSEEILTIRNSIIKVSKAIMEAKAHVRGFKTDHFLKEAIAEFDHLRNMLEIRPEEVAFQQKREAMSVCPEEYKGSTYGYPFFDKGFEMTNCSFGKKVSKLVTVTLLINAKKINHLRQHLPTLLKQVMDTYGNIPIIVAVKGSKENVDDLFRERQNLKLRYFLSTENDGKILNKLIYEVETKFLFIGRDIEHFDNDTRFERLIREMERQDVKIASGASRDSDGRWTKGCYQRALKNFTLILEEGYDSSSHECLYCDHTYSPFLIYTEFAKSVKFDGNLNDVGIIEDYFLTLMNNHEHQLIVCPDAMFHVDNTISNDIQLWRPFVKKWNVHQIKISSFPTITFPCDYNHCSKITGFVLHPCCLQELSDLIKFIFNFCKEQKMICELQEGTLLGTVKFGKVLPWERDGDLTFLTANYSVLQNIVDPARRAGYRVTDSGGLWCCVDNRTAGGTMQIHSASWEVQLYGQHLMDSEILRSKGINPTQILFDGQWVPAPRNPGLHARNRYGYDIYAHAQHWMDLGKKDSWLKYETRRFTKCREKRRHDCLDQFNGDGNMQFKMIVP